MLDPDDYQTRVATAVMAAIFETSLVERDGENVAFIVNDRACDALVDVLAAMMEGSPPCRTPKGMREASEMIGRKLLLRMKDVRKVAGETGARPFDGNYGVVN